MNGETQEAEIVHDSAPMPLAKREAGPLQQVESKPQITPAQAKVEAVAALTMAAYERAATLNLTQEERDKLQADFPDEAFQPGAAGKENLIYIEHAWLRDRFNSVFGMGQWAIVPRNRWAEPFRSSKGTEGSRVYVEAMLVVRGCFVGEAIGAMEYYPSNASQNYGDAVEGAKTAAFRRCAKEFGVGLQAWKKEWCEGWWTRKRSGGRQQAPQKTGIPSRQERMEQQQPKAETKPFAATDKTREWMIDQLKAGKDGDNRRLVTEYFIGIAALLPTENIEDLPLRYVPTSKFELSLLLQAIGAFEAGNKPLPAFDAHYEAEDTPPKKAPKAAEPEPPAEDEPWRVYPMPFGKNAGVPLGELDKKYLFGLAKNYKVETEYNGREKKPETIAKDELFRKMLDAAAATYGWEVSESVE